MNPLIDRARSYVDQAELYWTRQHDISVSYEDSRLQSINESDTSSLALRVIDRGRLGATYGIAPDRDRLVNEAKQAAAHGDPAAFSFAPEARYPEVANYSDRAARLSSEDVVALCEAVRTRILAKRPDASLRVEAGTAARHLDIETTQGAAATHRSSEMYIWFGAPFKGAGIGVYKVAAGVTPLNPPDDLVDEFVRWYGWGEATSTPRTGRLPVVFAPNAASLYLLPLWAGLDGDAVDKGTSPLIGRVGEAILSPLLTVVDDPLRADDPEARPFDDEAIPCQRRPLIHRGSLTGFLFDLRTAALQGTASTGNAVKRALFGGGTETAPAPWPMSLVVEPGDSSFDEMVADLDEGLVLLGGLGFHSGNYPQGQFSVQAVGFHVQGGRVVGRLENTMVSADIYTDLANVRAVSREQRRSFGMLGALAPYVLVDGLQVTGR